MSNFGISSARVRSLKKGKGPTGGPVLYWMSRDQRVRDNWALLHAQALALERNVPLVVVFTLQPTFLGATFRQYSFMLAGLEELSHEFHRLNIGFSLLFGSPSDTVPNYVRSVGAAFLVTDFSPLRISRKWKDSIARDIPIPFEEVDAHNIVPAWIASGKMEYSAATLRPKLHRLVPDFLTEIPQLTKHPFGDADQSDKNVWQRVRQYIQVDSSVASVDWIPAGEKAAFRMLDRFINHTLSAYDSDRNDPVSDGQSHLSPYFHFGQLSAQRAALSVRDAAVPKAARDAYLEELIVRRELADNFCLYCPSYDAIGAFPEWASRTLTRHRADERPYLYSGEILETAGTHDPIWNACQTEMVVRGKMHGYMRMYWAKKILEWTRAPEEALQTAIRLNDRYELDGRDPNGYAGIAWAIGGVHDRPWGEREIFGTVRYMNDRGIRRKFPMIDTYIRNNMHT